MTLLLAVPWKPSLTFNKEYAKDLFSYGWEIMATGILGILYTGLSELVLGRTVGSGPLGLYSQGRKWPYALISAATNSIQNVVFPAFAEKKDDMGVFRAIVKKALVSGSYIVIPLAFLAAVVAEPVVALLLTEKWLPCVFIFQMTCLSSCLMIVQVVNLRAYMALGDSTLYLKLQLIKVITGIVFICGMAILTEDIYWVSFATSIHGIFCVLGVDLIPAKCKIGLSWGTQMKLLLPIFAIAAIASVSSYALRLLGLGYLLEMMLQIIVFSSIYLLGSKIFKLEGYRECVGILKRFMHSR